MQHDVKSNSIASTGPSSGPGAAQGGGTPVPPLPDNGPIPFPGALRSSDPHADALPERMPAASPDSVGPPSWAQPALPEPAVKASRQLRKVWVLIAGTGVIIFAIIIAPLPGPGFTIFAPIGFAMLASEFMWAKRLANELENRTGFIERAAAFFVRTKNWWFLPAVVVIYWGLVFWLNHEKVLEAKYLFPLAGGLSTPVGYLAWRTIVHWHNARKAARERAQA